MRFGRVSLIVRLGRSMQGGPLAREKTLQGIPKVLGHYVEYALLSRTT
jgi:hypothetical protein